MRVIQAPVGVSCSNLDRCFDSAYSRHTRSKAVLRYDPLLITNEDSGQIRNRNATRRSLAFGPQSCDIGSRDRDSHIPPTNPLQLTNLHWISLGETGAALNVIFAKVLRFRFRHGSVRNVPPRTYARMATAATVFQTFVVPVSPGFAANFPFATPSGTKIHIVASFFCLPSHQHSGPGPAPCPKRTRFGLYVCDVSPIPSSFWCKDLDVVNSEHPPIFSTKTPDLMSTVC